MYQVGYTTDRVLNDHLFYDAWYILLTTNKTECFDNKPTLITCTTSLNLIFDVSVNPWVIIGSSAHKTNQCSKFELSACDKYGLCKMKRSGICVYSLRWALKKSECWSFFIFFWTHRLRWTLIFKLLQSLFSSHIQEAWKSTTFKSASQTMNQYWVTLYGCSERFSLCEWKIIYHPRWMFSYLTMFI